MAEMYKNIKNGVKAELVEINEKTKQVTLKKEDGKLTASNLSAFEKYWKKIEAGDSDTKKDAPADNKKAEKKAEKKPEQPKTEKPKKEKVKKSEVNKEARLALVEKLSKTYPGIKIDENYFSLKVGDKIAFAGAFGAKDIRVCAISAVLPADVKFETRKNALNAVIRVTYESSEDIFTMIKYAEDNFKDSDVLKKKRKGKEKSEKVEKPKKEEAKKSEKEETEEKK